MGDWHQSIHWALVEAGFEPVSNAKSHLAYRGKIHTRTVDLPILLQIDDDMVEPPSVTLLERPGILSEPLPHIGEDSTLCYLDPQLSTMDPLNPGGMIGACLQKAGELLDDLLAGRKNKDAERELPMLWFPQLPAFSTLPRPFSGSATLFNLDGKSSILLLATSENEAKAYVSAWPLDEMTIKHSWPAYVLKSPNPIRPLSPWPIKTAQQFVRFIENVSPALAVESRRFINLRVGSDLVLVVDAPNGRVGGLFQVPSQYRKRPEFKTRPKALLQAFNRENWPFQRMTFLDMSQKHLVSRNLGEQGLGGKKVMLIGCGTVGGFLAEMLLKIGAGTDGGRLMLVDNDNLLPGNIGRHVLGLRYLMRNKAEACKEHLGLPVGPAQVDVWTEDVRGLRKSMWRYDLIIDATGDEAISEWLNIWRISQLATTKCPPILHSWIEGPGAAGVAFLNAWPHTGCYRCLKTPTGAPRFQILSVAEPNAGLVVASCAEASFIRYPVSVSTHTAALALQVIVDWLRVGLRRSLRHVQIDPDRARAGGAHNVSQIRGCPACSNPSSPPRATSAG